MLPSCLIVALWTSLTRQAHMIAFVSVCLAGILASPVDVLCQTCGEQGDETPPPQAFFTAPSTVTCTDFGTTTSNHDMPSGSFYPTSTSFRIDTSETITGVCNYCVNNQYLYSLTRYLIGVTRDTTDPALSTTHALTSAPYHDQSLDTHDDSGHTGSGYHLETLNQLGTWSYDFKASAYATNCTPPVDSSVLTMTMNAVSCRPAWWKLDLIRFGGHLPKGGYDVHNGGNEQGPATAPAVHG